MALDLLIPLAFTYSTFLYGFVSGNCERFTRYAEFDNYAFNISDTCLLYKSLTTDELNVCMLQCYEESKCNALLHNNWSGKCHLLISSLTNRERLFSNDGSTYFVKGIVANMAVGKSISMSSTRDSFFGHFAVDGLVNTNFAHTLDENSPWYKIDLGQNYMIQRVIVYNRADCCGEQFRDVIIKIGPTLESFPSICGSFKGPGISGQEIEIVCNMCNASTGGRFVLLQIEGKPGQMNVLHINELKVFALS